MTVKQVSINGTNYLCVLTPHEANQVEKGGYVNIPESRRTKFRMGIPKSIQLKNAGISAPPVVY